MTIEEFIAANGLKMTAALADNNPYMPGNNMTHYRCTIRCGRRRMTVPFSQGFAHTSEPKLAAVLNCLASDAASVEDAAFEDWAADMGFDEDSRTAERTYKACQKQHDQLCRLLGEDSCAALLWNTGEAVTCSPS